MSGEPALPMSDHRHSEDSPKNDCYSEGERALMGAWQARKQRWLAPLLRGLTRAGISPDQVSLVSALFGIAFVPIYLGVPGAVGLAIAHLSLFLHLLIDGVDGPLARHQGCASAAGSFTDTCIDQLVVAVTSLAYGMAESCGRAGLAPLTASTYAILYTAAVSLAMARNAYGVPYRFLLRPRNFVFGLMWFDAYGWWGSLSPWLVEGTVWAFNLVLGAAVLTGCIALRRALKSAERDIAEARVAWERPDVSAMEIPTKVPPP